MKLWVIGELNPDPNEWDRTEEPSLIIAENADQARKIAGHGKLEPVTAVSMEKACGVWFRGTIDEPEENLVHDKCEDCAHWPKQPKAPLASPYGARHCECYGKGAPTRWPDEKACEKFENPPRVVQEKEDD